MEGRRMVYDPPFINAKADRNGAHLAALQANLMKSVAESEAKYGEPALTTNPFPAASPTKPLSLPQGRKRQLVGSPQKAASPTTSQASATVTSGWGAPPLSPRTSLASQRAQSPGSTTTPMTAWQQDTTVPHSAKSTVSTGADKPMHPLREKTQIERTLFHALLKLEAFTIQKDAVDQGDHRVHVVQDSLTEAELSITSRLDGRPTKEADTYGRLSNEVLHKIEEIIFPDPHLLPSEIALQQAGEQTAFQQNIKLRHDLELKDKKIYEQDEERKDLEMKLVQMEERQKALEETVTAARYAQFQAKQQLVTLQLESIEYRKQVDKTSNTINAAVQKKMGFVPWEAQKEIQNLATLTTAQVLKYENLVEADKDVLMIDP